MGIHGPDVPVLDPDKIIRFFGGLVALGALLVIGAFVLGYYIGGGFL